LLKVLENANTTRFASLVTRFCLEQRHLFAGGREVDWMFIRRIIMEKLPNYEDPESMAGLVANISAVLESNEWVQGDDPACQSWRGFSAAYLNQRWRSKVENGPVTISQAPPHADAPRTAVRVAAIATAVAGAVGYVLLMLS
jgi:hypothetical protein